MRTSSQPLGPPPCRWYILSSSLPLILSSFACPATTVIHPSSFLLFGNLFFLQLKLQMSEILNLPVTEFRLRRNEIGAYLKDEQKTVAELSFVGQSPERQQEFCFFFLTFSQISDFGDSNLDCCCCCCFVSISTIRHTDGSQLYVELGEPFRKEELLIRFFLDMEGMDVGQTLLSPLTGETVNGEATKDRRSDDHAHDPVNGSLRPLFTVPISKNIRISNLKILLLRLLSDKWSDGRGGNRLGVKHLRLRDCVTARGQRNRIGEHLLLLLLYFFCEHFRLPVCGKVNFGFTTEFFFFFG